ncbi:MAG: RecQ family ATP-dependent DNA helicase [Streptococcaceae bacterium]|jgi:ATP-dependent DNA helicase RecQ|nr:RecQ family ATP-dependent DNA helicase [Streptococcaceae bacterium]
MDRLQQVLQEQFGFECFREGQRKIILNVIDKKHTLGILPTATGKSLTYQLPAKILKGNVLIVCPLLSLMEDQVRSVQKNGEKRVIALNSSLDYLEKQYILQHLNEYKIVFAAPEMLFQPEVMEALNYFSCSLFVVDEAHCISTWGVDFRPDYLHLHKIQEHLGNPTTLALTATATPLVQKDIEQLLFKGKYETIRNSTERKNIGLVTMHTQNKKQDLLKILHSLKNKGSGIIYCATKRKCEELATLLQQETNQKVAYYHAGIDSSERASIQEQFLHNELDLLIATNAFGMGIDKPDIRYVIHYHLSGSLENYLQEFGRAGRDGEKSLAILLYKKGDEKIHHYFRNQTNEQQRILSLISQKTSEEINELLPTFPEIMQKWIKANQNSQKSLEQLSHQIEEKQWDKFLQLNKMRDYIFLQACQRNFIQQYFHDEITMQNEKECCLNCGLQWENFLPDKQARLNHKDSSWQEILSKIFNN